MGLPDWLTVEALQRRIDVELPEKEPLLAEYLLGAFEQAQEPPPLGTGRLLIPDPALAGDGSDTLDPVTREVIVRGRRVPIPDARTITALTVDGEAATGYRTFSKNGLIVEVTLSDEDCDRWELHRGRRARERTVEITGRFGFATPPMVLKEAIYTLAERRYYESESEVADTVKVSDGQSASVYYKPLPAPVSQAFGGFTVAPAMAGLS